MVNEVLYAFLNIIGSDQTAAFIQHENAFELLVQDYMRRGHHDVKKEAFDTMHLLFEVSQEKGCLE